MARKSARAAAMQLVYEKLMGGDGGEETLRSLIEFPENQEDDDYISDVLKGIDEHGEELDQLIQKSSKERELSRIARVDVAILRVALYEMLFRDDVPNKVVINEAVDMANKFSMPADSKFINGVLGNIAREKELV